MSRDSASFACASTVGTSPPRQHHQSGLHARAKVLSQPRLSPVRVEGRQLAAEVLGPVVSDSASQRSIAQVLRVSPELVQRWVDPASPKHIPVGDLVAVALAGKPGIVFAYFDELAKVLRPRTKPNRSPFDHAMAIVHTSGAASSALTFETDRALAVRRLRAVRQAADDALADLEAP